MNRSRITHYVIRGIILTGFASYISFLSKTGRLPGYMEPRMLLPVKLSALVLTAMAVYQAYLALVTIRTGRQAACECEELPPLRLKAVIVYAVFALPVILGFWGS
jgi:putative membrane protein